MIEQTDNKQARTTKHYISFAIHKESFFPRHESHVLQASKIVRRTYNHNCDEFIRFRITFSGREFSSCMSRNITRYTECILLRGGSLGSEIRLRAVQTMRALASSTTQRAIKK